MARTSAAQLAFNFDPLPIITEVKAWEPPPRREFVTRAYGMEAPMLIGMNEPDPVELEVRGIPTLIRFSSFFETYAVIPAGSEYWSCTGYRSFCGFQAHIEGSLASARLPDAIIVDLIEANIDSKHGCGGKLTKWWPDYCLRWRQEKDFARHVDRATTWDQWGPEKQSEHWAAFDARQAAALQRMAAEGIDPNEVWRTR